MKFETDASTKKSKTKTTKSDPVPQTVDPTIVGFEHEVPVKRLPSQGKSYPAGVRISYRGYTFGEVKSISQSSIGARAVYERILSGVRVVGMDPMSLTYHDATYLGFLRKVSSVGKTKAAAQYDCKNCHSTELHEIDLSQIEFVDMSAPAIPAVFEIQGKELHFAPITIGQFITVTDEDRPTDEISILASSVTNMSYEDALKTISSADLDEADVIRHADASINHGVLPVRVKCPKCEWPAVLHVEGVDQIVLPFRVDARSVASRVRFGLQASR